MHVKKVVDIGVIERQTKGCSIICLVSMKLFNRFFSFALSSACTLAGSPALAGFTSAHKTINVSPDVPTQRGASHEGMARAEVLDFFNISPATLTIWLRKRRDTGDISPVRRGRYKTRKLDDAQLLAYI